MKDVESKKEERLSKYLPKEKVSKSLSTLKDSLRSVYPEYYVIFSAGIDAWNMYKEPVITSLSTCKDYIATLYKFFIG